MGDRNREKTVEINTVIRIVEIAGVNADSPGAIGEKVALLVKRWPDELNETLHRLELPGIDLWGPAT